MNTSRSACWMPSKRSAFYPKLQKNFSTDVVIIGAGVTGLTSALLLKQAGKKVAVLDRGEILSGDTGKTTAHLTEVIDTRYSELLSTFGKSEAFLVADSNRAAIQKIEELVRRYRIPCDFLRVPGFLFTEDKHHLSILKKELSSMKLLGTQAKWCQEIPISFPTQGGLRIENQAQLNPREYLLNLAHEIEGQGSFIFEHTPITEIEEGNPCRVRSENHIVEAKKLIIATYSPVFNRFFLQTKIAAYRTYAIGFRIKPKMTGLFWDIEDPYHYIRFHNRLCIVGGEDHKTGKEPDTTNKYNALREFARKRFSFESLDYQWSGQILEPIDGLPYIGLNPFSKHIYVATGFAGNGMTFGTISAMLISDLILNVKNPWTHVYRANRIEPIASVKEFISENKDFPITLIKDCFQPKTVAHLTEVKEGQAKVVNLEGNPLAVFHDSHGIHAVSAICTHLGCKVRWNNAEQSWDCPCHGSRFDVNGIVLNGPAVANLKPYTEISKIKERKKQAA